MKARLRGYIIAGLLLFPCTGTGGGQEADVKVPAQATVDGNYSNLVRTIKVPEDEKQVGKFCDLGYYPEAEYAGFKDLEPGYWVYVAPNWYIWKDSKKPHEPEPTVDGPEARDIVGRVAGYIVIGRGTSEIAALSLPTMRETVVRPEPKEETDFYPTVHALSGPDAEGRIAYIEDHFFVKNEADRKHLLKTVKVDGTGDTEVFSHPGDAMWAGTGVSKAVIGTYIALAPFGGRVALLSALKRKQMTQALLRVGTIEIWDVAGKKPLAFDMRALDQPMSWFPDGKRLAYVKLVPRDRLPKPALGLDEFGTFGGHLWDEVPAVHVLDTQSGASTFLHVGWTPIVSSDGKTVLVGGWNVRMEFIWKCFTVSDGRSAPVRLPGDAVGPIAAPSENLVLYWGLPTTGAPIKYTKHNSMFQGGPRPMLTLKVAAVDSNRFQTVAPEISPVSLVSFGRVSHRPLPVASDPPPRE